MRLFRRLALMTLSTAILFAAGNASALTVYTDVIGTDVSFTGIQESSTFGDPEPLFDQPLGVGNQLLFFPPAFSASSAGGGVDQTGSQLQLMISGNSPTDTIDVVKIDEFGDATLTGAGTAATGVFAGMSGFVTVTETTSGPIAPVIIPFIGDFTPTNIAPDLNLDLPTNPGTTVWSGTTTIDVAGAVPNATKAFLSFDNNLFAFSEAGSSATVQKKVVSGPAVVITVPEPGTLLLLGSCTLAIAIRRGRRSNQI